MITVKKSEYNKAKLRKLFREASQKYIQITEEEAAELGLIEQEPEDYFIYIGLNCPDETTDILNDNSWINIGQDISIYTKSNPAYNGTITLDPEYNNVICYIAIPLEMQIYDAFGLQSGWNLYQENITIKGHKYNIFSQVLEGEFTGLIY